MSTVTTRYEIRDLLVPIDDPSDDQILEYAITFLEDDGHVADRSAFDGYVTYTTNNEVRVGPEPGTAIAGLITIEVRA